MPKQKKSSRHERRSGARTTEDLNLQPPSVRRNDNVHDNDNQEDEQGMESHIPRKTTHSNDENIRHIDFPLRDTHSLFASTETIACVTQNHCVPCAYKIGLFDVAMDKEFCQKVPNQRPEQCPRLVALTRAETNKSTVATNPLRHNPMGYQPGMSVLTVGDGDFSFSLALARILFAPRMNAKTVSPSLSSTLVATSYEREETLRKVYDNFDVTLEELHRLGATTHFQVDATRLDQTLFHHAAVVTATTSSLPQSPQLFHRICWNFPCTAIAKGQDGQNQEMEANKQLVREFVTSARPFLVKDGGEIHICHKTKPPFNQWKLEQAALEGSCCIDSENRTSPIFFAGRVVLDRALLPPYIPRKALDRKSFPCHDACFYIFPTSKTPPSMGQTPSWRFEPTIRQVDAKANDSNADDFAMKAGNDDEKNNNLCPVTPTLILSLRTRSIRAQAKRTSKAKASRYSSGHGRKRQRR